MPVCVNDLLLALSDEDESSEESEEEMETDSIFAPKSKGKHDLMMKSEVRLHVII